MSSKSALVTRDSVSKQPKTNLGKKNQFETSLTLSLYRVINPRDYISKEHIGMNSVNGTNSSHLERGRPTLRNRPHQGPCRQAWGTFSGLTIDVKGSTLGS